MYLLNLSILAVGSLVFVFVEGIGIPSRENGIDIKVTSGSGKRYDLNLVKAEGTVLHSNIKYITVDTDPSTGHESFNAFNPSKLEMDAAENVYIDENSLATVRMKHEDGQRQLEGVVDGMKFEEINGNSILSEIPTQNRSDYIETGMKFTPSRFIQVADPVIIETLVVCDKEFGDVFQHNRIRILDYLTVYFWDLNLRYKTLPSSSISFRVTGVVVIANTNGQPFIEQARRPDGKADFNNILPLFRDWVRQQSGSLPKFDLAVAITNAQLVWGGGLAYIPGACSGAGGAVFNDAGDWGSITNGAHEIAHTMGANHDEDIPGCSASGYIMSGGTTHKWFFSSCSDKAIRDYVSSGAASCLRRIDEGSLNPISPDFSFIYAPTMDEQCKRKHGSTAFIEEQDTANCERMRCLVPISGGWRIHTSDSIDNTICRGGGRCFRGRCRRPGSLIGNVGSGQCLLASNQFAFTVTPEMVPCPQPGTPLDRFLVSDNSIGKTLATPWNTADATEKGDRCVYAGNGEGTTLQTDRCNPTNPWHGWDFLDAGNGEFMLSHRVTSRCAKQVGNRINVYANCNRNDASMRWKLR